MSTWTFCLTERRERVNSEGLTYDSTSSRARNGGGSSLR